MEVSEYRVSIAIDFESLNFKGLVELDIHDCIDNLELDAVDLQIDHVKANGSAISFNHDRNRGKATLENPKGNLTIAIDYSGRAGESTLTGLYKAGYRGGYVLVTQFEPTGARRLFPCLDNPSFKSVFKLDVTVANHLTVISNTPAEREEQSGSSKRIFFKATPKMSTYLLFLGVGEFEQSSLPCNSAEVISASVKGKVKEADYASREACKTLSWYEKFFDIPYPLEKLHLIAVPDFAAGAMENWGAITFRESAMLIGEYAGAAERKIVSEVVAHEIAHQWFGNLVTMRWWNNLWLNESFATFMSYKAVNALHPEWGVWSSFLRENFAGSLYEDSLSSTHPIDVAVDSPDEIAEVFDQISYGKGASIIRMIEGYIGDEYFRKGVNNYLIKNKYANTDGVQLWSSLQEASGLPVKEVMSAWVSTPGHPVVMVEYAGNGAVKLTQKRFTFLGEPSDTLWPIPVTVVQGGSRTTLLFNTRTTQLQGVTEPVLLNVDATGFYRVLYDKQNMSLLIEKFMTLSPTARWTLVSDYFAFLMAGEVGADDYLRLVEAASLDTDYLMVNTVLSQLNALVQLDRSLTKVTTLIEAHCRRHLSRIGYEYRGGEHDNDTELRQRLLNSLVSIDDEFAKDMSLKFGDYRNLRADQRAAVAHAYAITNGPQSYTKLAELLRAVDNDTDAERLISAMVSIRDASTVKDVLDAALKGAVPLGNVAWAVIGAIQNHYSRIEAWNWLKKSIDPLREIYKGTGTVSILAEACIEYVGLTNYEEIRGYFSERTLPEAQIGIKKGFELLEVNRRVLSSLRTDGA
ncbi:MAG: M1 family metallopeptidase [Candidatus Marsarchaeota archaeon]|nr:M1 family metallopeptidase [Candidatus Marsarchaeota archaeon]